MADTAIGMASHTQDLTAPTTEETLRLVRDTVGCYLQRMSFTPLASYSRDMELAERVKAATAGWDFETDIRLKHVVTGLTLTEAAYSHLDIDARVAVAIYTSLNTACDDPKVLNNLRVRDFLNGSYHDEDGLLGHIARSLAGIHHHFPPFGTSMIITGMMRWFAAEILTDPCDPLFVKPSNRPFADYQRSMSGNGEGYAAFIWQKSQFPDERVWINALPDAVFYINQGNDILSFYKETLEGDTSSYIHSRASIAGQCPYETLREVIDEVVAATERIHAVLGTGPARDAWDSFEAGYIQFHFGDPRYRLQEVFGNEYMMDRTTVFRQ